MGQGQSSIPEDELRVLLELYEALDGDRWRRRDGWKQPTADPETWYGVEVMMGHVVTIELPANELSGAIPESVQRLASLRVLNLSKNKLRGKRVCLDCNTGDGVLTSSVVLVLQCGLVSCCAL